MQELEQLRTKQSSNLRKISELEQRARVAEADSHNKQREITRLRTGGCGHNEELLTVVEQKDKQIVDLQMTRDRLNLELEEKEQQRNEATQKNITLQNKVRVVKQDSFELKNKAEEFEMCYNQVMEEKKQLEVKVAELNKLMDAEPTTYIDGEAPEEDVDEKAVITQQQGRIKMLEKEVGQLRQIQEHSKAQSSQLKLQQKASEVCS